MKLLITTQAVDENDPALGFFIRWIEEFAKHCEEVVVVCLQAGTYTLPPNVRVHSLGKERGVPPLRKLVYALRFLKCMWHERRSNAVFVHMNPEYVLLGGLFWKCIGTPIGLWYEHKSVNWVLRVAVALATHTFSASSEGLKISTRNAHVMGHGIDTTRPVPVRVPTSGTVRLMTSGRIAPVKRLDVIIAAFLQLKRSGVKATLAIFGAPTSPATEAYAQGLRTDLENAGEDPTTVFRGPIPHADMPEQRAAMDYFLHASETGSLDKAVLDAILSGVIPISSSAAYHELFAGFRELQYPKGDAGALVERVRALEAVPEKRNEIRQVLQQRVQEHHSLATLIPRILSKLQ